jgi:iron complex outermembrane receptor protein
MLVPRFKPAHAAGLIAVFVACTGALLSAAPLSAQAQSSNTNAAATATPMSKAQPQGTVAFDIPAQDLSAALTEFARQSGQELIYNPASATGKVANAVEGEMSRASAMQQLLQGTGLEFLIMPSGGMMLGNPDEVQSYRAKLQSSSAEAAADASAEVAQAAPTESLLDPSLTDPGTAAPGEQTTSKVEVSRIGGIEEIIVTGQKKAERLQDVPIAISAFSMEDLDNQKIEGGFDLLKNVPNVTFSKTNFSGYNFQIRGIGTQAISATTDPGVAVSFNNTTLIVNRLFEQEYLDIERVEVLRGPQGTLYGRNATGGVINVISAKPEMGVQSGEAKIEAGNYGAQRFRGHYNLPLGDEFAIRGAYASTVRDGYGYNEFDGSDVDDRDLWTGRITAAWEPNDRFKAYLMWERFEEDDQRVRTSKQLCHRDDTLTEIFGIPTEGLASEDLLSQGCEAGSLYDAGAYGTVNGSSLPYVTGLTLSQAYSDFFVQNSGRPPSPYTQANAPCFDLGFGFLYLHDVCNPDPYGGRTQSRDLRSIYSQLEPKYQADSDIYEFAFDFRVTDDLTLSSQTVYAEDQVWATQDYNRFESDPFWEDMRQACGQIDDLFGPIKDCSDNPDTGRGTYMPLQDLDGDGWIELADRPVLPGQTVDQDGWVRDAEGRRVGWHSYFFPGEFCDPQLGCSDKLLAQDLSRAKSKQFNQEFRLVSSFDGPVNFSVGANFTKFETFNDYFVFSNAFTALLHTGIFNGPISTPTFSGATSTNFIDPDGFPFLNNGLPRCRPYEVNANKSMCRYVDPNPINSVDGEGHNYFRSGNPYELTSTALFGEVYWNVTDALKLTVGARMTWDQKVFTPLPSQLLLADYRDLFFVGDGDQPVDGSQCAREAQAVCPFTGNAPDGRGFVANPDIVQNWREPTGRIVLDWKPDWGLDWVDDSMVYASLARGYKGGGANPPSVAPPSGNVLSAASGASVAPTFKPEYVNALELGTKNTLFGGAVTFNLSGFYYDYKDYQVSKIVDRTAANENFDATVWGLELETMFAPTPDTLLNATVGYLRTRIADGESSIDLMDRAAGGDTPWTTAEGYEWLGYTVVKPWVVAASNCVFPTQVLAAMAYASTIGEGSFNVADLCPAGGVQGGTVTQGSLVPYFDEAGEYWSAHANCAANQNCSTRRYTSATDAPNMAQGFAKNLGGKELPNAPRFTVALGAQHTFYLPAQWELTGRVDWYWQGDSYARVYNTEYDELRAWNTTNLSLWIERRDWGLKVETYVKNAFDETPITGTFLNSDDSGLTTNVFTLDPRLIGLSVTKRF